MGIVKKNQNHQGPSCACGKTDLYEEWIKLQENQKREVSDSTTSSITKEYKNFAKDVGKDTQNH